MKKESSPALRVASDGWRHCFTVTYQRQAKGAGARASAHTSSPRRGRYLRRCCSCQSWGHRDNGAHTDKASGSPARASQGDTLWKGDGRREERGQRLGRPMSEPFLTGQDTCPAPCVQSWAQGEAPPALPGLAPECDLIWKQNLCRGTSVRISRGDHPGFKVGTGARAQDPRFS